MPPDWVAPPAGSAVTAEAIVQGANALGLPLTPQQASSLLAYLALISKWTRVYNLTSVRDPVEMLTHHLLDSLAVVPALQRQFAAQTDPAEGRPNRSRRLLDVGSGAGLPGIVLAVVMPDLSVTCVDTVGKKATFIRQAAAELGLKNLEAQHTRVEQLRAAPFDVVTSRAFSSLRDFTTLSVQHLPPEGVWMAMKGKLPSDEMAVLPTNVEVFHVEQLQVPGLMDAERCLVWMRPKP